MTDEQETSASASPTSPGGEDKLDRILGLLGGLAQRVEKLEGSQPQTPQFVPMRQQPRMRDAVAGTYQPPERLLHQEMRRLTQAGQSASGNVGPLENPDYIKKLPPQYRPVFRSGDIVRINPRSLVWGSERTWEAVLLQVGVAPENAVGEVLAIQYSTKTWEPKYTVHVPKLTQGNGD